MSTRVIRSLSCLLAVLILIAASATAFAAPGGPRSRIQRDTAEQTPQETPAPAEESAAPAAEAPAPAAEAPAPAPEAPAPTAEAPAPAVEAPAPAAENAPLLAKVMAFLAEDEWKYEQVQGTTILRMAFKGDNGQWTVIVQSKEVQGQVLFYSISAQSVENGRREAVAEYLHRANYGRPLGNFEMDFDDGEVRFKTSIDVEGAELTPTQIRNLIYVNVVTFDRYLPGLNSVIAGELEPAAAIEKVEKK